ncbi:MAG TPA: ABC transporter permease [Acetobacteraceae bacterium]|nr:ABC transporter permease [Acetobacteraceae bacterium]
MFRRILALMLKELVALWKDPKTRRVILIPPIVQVVLFAYAANYDVTNVSLGIWNEDAGAQSAELVRRFAASPAFHVVLAPQSPGQARTALDAKDVAAVLHLPQTFSADVLAGRTAQAQLLVDARRSNTALLLQGYAADIVAGYASELHPGHTPLVLLTRDWFNPTLESTWFILPGLVCVLSMIMALLISALALSRERELGTLEQLLVTPLRPLEILCGKALPGIIVGMLDANIVIVAALLWFRLPFRGDLILLQAMLVLYTLTGTAIGLAISSLARTQQQAMLGVFVIASPMIVLSGYAAPVENMPPAVEFIARADPVRYMLIAARGLFLQDMPVGVVLQQAWPMALIALVMLVVAGVAVRRAVG